MKAGSAPAGLSPGGGVQRLRQPEELDRLFTLSSPIGWLAIVVAALVIGATVVWGFLGSIPYQVYGMGIIRQQGGRIYPLIAPAEGVVTVLYVDVGESVHRGDKIAEIALPDEEAKRQAAQRNLDNLQQLYQRQSTEAQHAIKLRQDLTNDTVASQRSKIAAARERLSFLNNYHTVLGREMDKGFVARPQVEQVAQQIDQAEQIERDANTAIFNARSQQVDFEDQQARALSQLSTQILEAENSLNQATVAVNTRNVVTSPIDGTVAEIDTKLGSQVKAADQLVMIQQSGAHLEMVAYLPVQTGKTVEPNMTALVSPTTVESSIYGSIKGSVVSVSKLSVTEAAAMDTLGNSTEVKAIFDSGPVIEAIVKFVPDPHAGDGVAWTSSTGPGFPVTPGTMATIAVKTRQVHPIDLAVPIYETWIGGG